MHSVSAMVFFIDQSIRSSFKGTTRKQKWSYAVYFTFKALSGDKYKGSSETSLAGNLACLVSGTNYCDEITKEKTNDNDKNITQLSLAKSLACLVDETPNYGQRRCRTRMELKRLLEIRIKKRVKEQYMNGKYRDLMAKVIANPRTLQDAYNCIRLNSNINLELGSDNISFESITKELLSGSFDVNSNSYSKSTKGERKEVLFLPNLKLKVVQEAIRIVVEVVYKPHFSKISHGCRSGRGHHSALRHICKEFHDADWWFTLLVSKKVDARVLSKLISTMEEKIEDQNLYAFIRCMYDAQVLNLEFGGFPKGHGLPQEGVLSPILMNVYLDLFDRELYKMCIRYEALGSKVDLGRDKSKLRRWFRKQLKDDNDIHMDQESFGVRIHACRFMDEMFFAISGPKEVASEFKTEIQNFLQNSLHLDAGDHAEILPINSPHGIRFLGILVRTSIREGPAVRAVHKLKQKIQLFASQRKDAWDAGTVRIGKKWLAHGLKKVKESEIKHLADSSSILSRISCFRKAGMETDHWFKHLLKIWLQDVNAKAEASEDVVLSKYIAEPALPQELRDSYYKFQKCVDEYISSETASILALMPNTRISTQSTMITEIMAPVNVIQKRLLRYGLSNSEGYSCAASALIFHDNIEIIEWFSGLARRWLRWYCECNNFNEVKVMIVDQIRKSCIRTLASKHRIHENEIERKFESELSSIPSIQEIELEMATEVHGSQVFDNDEALMYGISYSGMCLLSLSRMVSQSRPCNCFVLGCLAAAPRIYTLHVMERQKFPGWKTGFSISIHPSLNRRRIGLCKQHVKDLFLGHISLQSIDFGT